MCHHQTKAGGLIGAADLHAHPLPGIDDGAVSLDATVAMARLAAASGTSVLAATPHRNWAGRENRPELIRDLVVAARKAIGEAGLGHQIHIVAGQEVPLRMETADELTAGAVLSLADAGRAILVEPPFDQLPAWTAQALAHIVDSNVTPVLAHPERNSVIQQRPQIVSEFVAAGAILQLTAMSVIGENGPAAQAAALWMLDAELACIIASDAHSATWRPPDLSGAYGYLCDRYGRQVAERLCVETPGALITPCARGEADE